MSDLESRIQHLENMPLGRQLGIKELDADELAELATGIPGTKADDLTDKELEAMAKGEKTGK